MSRRIVLRIMVAALFWPLHANPLAAQATDAPPADVNALAKQQQNPISSLVSVPLQFNFNTGGGLEDQTFLLLNAQPVIPFRVNEHWNAISRTVVPIASVPGADGTSSSGIGDIQLQLYLTPSKSGSFVWGGGPVVSAPTATTSGLKTGSWAAGPTFVALTMPGPWVVGVLANNVWTFSDAGDDTKMNQFLLQPFVNLNFGKGWALSSVPIITANWDADSGQQWTVPVGLGIGRTTVFSGRPMLLAVHYYANVVHPDAAASSQLRFMVVFLFPKR
jgi:hypothetical protein